MKSFILASMILASPTIAQTRQPQYTLDFKVGNSVDLNQGFYVCSTGSPSDLMTILMGIKDTKVRRVRAESSGCPFRLSGTTGPIYKITNLVADVCMNKTIDHGVLLCGIEGHQLTVDNQGNKLTVMQLSLDIDFD